MAKFIDLGRKPSNDIVAKPSDKPYYPTVHLSGVDADLSVGDEVMIKCRVKRATEEDDGSYSCDLECKQMRAAKEKERGELSDALDKIEKDKVAKEAKDEGEPVEEEAKGKEDGDTYDEE